MFFRQVFMTRLDLSSIRNTYNMYLKIGNATVTYMYRKVYNVLTIKDNEWLDWRMVAKRLNPLYPYFVRRIRRVLRWSQHPDGVRAVERGGGEELHGLPGLDVRDHGTQRLEDRRRRPRRGVQRAGRAGRRAHPHYNRMPVLQVNVGTLPIILCFF